MNTREIAEIKRRLNPDKRNATVIRGCYIRGDGSVISKFEQSVGLLSDEEMEQYMSVFKKVLSGAVNRNFIPVDFSVADIHSEKNEALMDALSTSLTDADSVQPLFDNMIAFVQDLPEVHTQSVNDAQTAANYLILLMHDRYDIPTYDLNDELDADRSDTVFHYLIGCVCPVKPDKSALSYDYADGAFHARIGKHTVSMPQTGFLYPAYEEGGANLYRVMFYAKDTTPENRAFVPKVFGVELNMSSDDQHAAFQAVLQDTLGKECTLEIVQAVHESMRSVIDENKADKTAEAPTLSAPQARQLIESCGVSHECAETFETQYKEAFGPNAEIPVANLIQAKKYTVDLPNVSIHVSPEYSSLIQTRWLEGRPYLVIPVEGDVEVNGMRVLQSAAGTKERQDDDQ